MKAVLIMYPIFTYADGDSHIRKANALYLSKWRRLWQSALDLSKGEFRDRFRLINKLIEEYRGQDHRVYWGVFSDPKNKSKVGPKSISDIFEVREEDKTLPVGVTAEELIHDYKYPNEQYILNQMPNLSSLVLGGFHETDCVSRIAVQAGKIGIPTKIDRFLTEHFFWTMLETFDHDLFAKLIKEGKLDPVMHEDDPEEMKWLMFEGRLDKYIPQIEKSKK